MADTLQSAGFVFSLLNWFTQQKPQWGVRELAREVGRSPSVVQRALNLLEQQGFVQQDAVSRTWQLGMRCIELGHLASRTLPFSRIAGQCLRPVVDECGETVFIYRRRDDRAVCSFILESPQHIRFTATVGESLYLHQAPFTQVTLAALPQEEREAYLTRHHLQNDGVLLAALRRWAEQGYATSREAWQPHTQGLSVPLFDAQRRVAGSLCIAASSMRDDLIDYTGLLQRTAARLSSVL